MNGVPSASPRQRRLEAEAGAVAERLASHPQIKVTPVGAVPADTYRVTYQLRGVMLGADGQPAWSDEHRVLIQLGSNFPRQRPLATVETPIFHPNIGPRPGDEICIVDFWSPTETLVDIVIKIGELIQYQRYSLGAPLNAVAARWSAENQSIFPVGHVGLY